MMLIETFAIGSSGLALIALVVMIARDCETIAVENPSPADRHRRN